MRRYCIFYCWPLTLIYVLTSNSDQDIRQTEVGAGTFSCFRDRERDAKKERGSGKKKEAPSTTEKMRKIVLFSSFAV
jgi:hypothetical protein